MGNIVYFIKEGARGFYQAKLMTFVSIVTIAVVLLLASIITVGMINVRKLFENAVEQADFVVYVKESASSDSTALVSLLSVIRSLPQVSQASLVNKAAAWERFASIYGREMLNAVDDNPFPVSIEITMKNGYQSSSAAANLKEHLETLDGVDGVRFAREWMDFLARFRWYFYTGAVVLGIIMFLTLHITISNAIRLTIYARRELVRNMRLVGATKVFTAMPFIIEGMIQGFIGGTISIAFFYLLKAVFTWEPSLRTIPLAWGPPVLPALFLLLGVLFGWTGSVSSVRKFLA
ncbi:MAG: ABC transporter permease [Chitinispirillaceae bacterium]|jgi:cell division transport system permease protein